MPNIILPVEDFGQFDHLSDIQLFHYANLYRSRIPWKRNPADGMLLAMAIHKPPRVQPDNLNAAYHSIWKRYVTLAAMRYRHGKRKGLTDKGDKMVGYGRYFDGV